jgi:hypothetical protein
MAMTNEVNGRVRKSLAHQLDRLDSILNGLAEALDESIAQAVRDAVGIAVREAIEAAVRELLSRPELLAALRPAEGPAPPPADCAARARRAGRRACGGVRALLAPVGGAVRWVAAATDELFRPAGTRCAEVTRALVRRTAGLTARLVAGLAMAVVVAWHLRRRMSAAAAAGVAAGMAGYLAGPVVTAAACGMVAASVTLAVLGGTALATRVGFGRANAPRVMPAGGNA